MYFNRFPIFPNMIMRTKTFMVNGMNLIEFLTVIAIDSNGFHVMTVFVERCINSVRSMALLG